MRAASISIFLALATLSLETNAVPSPTCHTDQTVATGNPETNIVKDVHGGIESICTVQKENEVFPDNDTLALCPRSTVTLRIKRPSTDVQPIKEHCIEAYTAILEQCIEGRGLFGELSPNDRFSYEIEGREEESQRKRGLNARGKAKNSTQSCKEIAREAAVGDQAGKNVTNQLAKGNRTLLRRTLMPKVGHPCGVNGFNSNPYRDYQDHLVHHPQTGAYGFLVWNDCSSYRWIHSAHSQDFTWATTHTNVGFATEHLLEWQIISGFFDYLNETAWPNHRFTDPDPNRPNRQCNFAQYFTKQWAWPNLAANTRRFAMPGRAAATPFEHIANAYPSDTFRANELVLLQAELNGIKARVFSDQQVYDRIITEGMVSTNPRLALWRVRQAIGVQRYLLETRHIFAHQVNQIRSVIVDLDNHLPAHPRLVGNRWFAPWITQGLGPWFDHYMDEVWRGAQHELSSFISDIYEKIRLRCTPQLVQQYQTNGDQNMITLCADLVTMRPLRNTYGVVPKPW